MIWFENGELKGVATNVAPEMKFIILNGDKKEFDTYKAGLPFRNEINHTTVVS